MNSQNILVKLNNAGFRQNGKWLVEGVSLNVEKGKWYLKFIMDMVI